jgi:predicted nucleic acid-binding protein
MIVLDTSLLIDALTGAKHSAAKLRQRIQRGDRMAVPALVLFEWLRGPRVPQELKAQEALFPSSTAIPFGPDEAMVAAQLYKTVSRPRRREIDLAIAACAIVRSAELWTLNPADFRDLKGLRLTI